MMMFGKAMRPDIAAKLRSEETLGQPIYAPVGEGLALAGKGLSAIGKAAGVVKAAATTAAPIVKYELVKNGLERMGVPGPLAAIPAAIAAGYKPGTRTSPRLRTTTPRASAPAAAVAAEAPVVAETAAVATPKPVAAPTASVMSPQRIQNELGLAARRSGAKLTEPQYDAAAELVRKGATPVDAVKSIAGMDAAPAAPRAKINAAETKEYIRLRNMGKTDAEAKTALTQLRELAGKMGTPTSEDVRTRVAARNNSGRWQ